MKATLGQPGLIQAPYPLFAMLALFLLGVICMPVTARAEITTNVDNRVSVVFSPMVVGQTVKTYQTDATVTNISNGDILAPVRLIISNIGKKNTSVANADGVASSGDAFVEIMLEDGVLKAGESSLPTSIKFVRQVGNAPTESPGKGKGKNKNKNKKPGFPTFSFEHSVEGGTEVALGKPASVPFALKAEPGSTDVVFSVSAVTEGATFNGSVVLHGPGLGNNGVEMDDEDSDGVYTLSQAVTTTGLAGGECLAYRASTLLVSGDLVQSPVYNLCATSFPLVIGESNTNDLVVIGNTPAVGDEILVFFETGTPDSQVQQLLQQLGGEVIGTLLPQRAYQIRLPAVQSAQQLQQLIEQASNFAGVTSATPNHVGAYTSTPSDPDFSLQHGMQLISADSLAGMPKYVWDANATGGGITVLVLDSGIQANPPAPHPDVAPLPENTAGDNTDTLGHGTEMAGIIAATTDNAIGIAGTARAASLRSIKVSADDEVTELEMLSGLTTALPLAGPNAVVNASFSIFGLLVPTENLCSAIDDLIVAGSVVVNSAGNDNNSTTGVWPGMCNDPTLNGLLGSNVIADPNKPSFIVVAASNCNAGSLDTACPTDSRKPDSNFGAWVDIAAPGVNVRSTTITSVDPTLYTNSDGTSAAAALTSGAAAILRSCGVPTTSVFSTLDLGATVSVTPDFNRINLYNSLASLNTPPTAVSISGGTTTFNENIDTDGGVLIGNLATADANTCDAHSYMKTGGPDAGKFSINTSNQLFFDDDVLDFETQSSYSVQVTSTDFFGASTNQTFTVTVNDIEPELLGSDSVADPSGDSGGETCCDISDVTVTSTITELTISIRYHAGYDPTLISATVGIDTDQDTTTGQPGVAAAGTIDAGVIGVDYLAFRAGRDGAATVPIEQYVGPPINTFINVGDAPVTYVADGYDIVIPHSLLGGDDGFVDVKVISAKKLSPAGNTGILDIAPDEGSPPLSISP